MAERVHVVADLGRQAELFAVVALAVLELLGERFGHLEIAVGLDDHAAHRSPSAGGDELADPLEQNRVALLDLPVEPAPGAGELELGVLVQALAALRAVARTVLTPSEYSHSQMGSRWALPIMCTVTVIGCSFVREWDLWDS